jgi:toxin CcdB
VTPVQYDVCQVGGNSRPRRAVSLAVVLQDNNLSDFHTRVIVPLVPADERLDVQKTSVSVSVSGDRYVAAVQLLTSVHVRELGPPIANLAALERAFKTALDRVLFGV